jgi:aryl-alcohol dehydrogenase-like predicted oxidoreductase
MEYVNLGRTGLTASVAGLGCGGPSRLGLRKDAMSEKNAIALVRQAIELGVNFIDTAESYGTEAVVGKAIREVARSRVILSTKKTLPDGGSPDPERELAAGLERSLERLGTEYVDIYHLHGLEPRDYPFARERLLPAMLRLREQGKIRFIGVTEAFVTDAAHAMLRESLGDDVWDIVMVGFNLLNPSARRTVFPVARQKGIGVLNMFAVRRALSQPERLNGIVADLIRKGAIDAGGINPREPLDFVLAEGGAATLPEAAYRFCRHEPGVDVVLFGTGNPAHLKANVEAILKPPLAGPALRKLEQLFGGLDYLTGN